MRCQLDLYEYHHNREKRYQKWFGHFWRQRLDALSHWCVLCGYELHESKVLLARNEFELAEQIGPCPGYWKNKIEVIPERVLILEMKPPQIEMEKKNDM